MPTPQRQRGRIDRRRRAPLPAARLPLHAGAPVLLLAALLALPASAAPASRPSGPRALKLLRAGRAAEAAEVLQAALRDDPKSAALTTDLGYALARLGRQAEAEAAFRRAIGLDPRRWYAYANLASLHTGGALPAGERDELAALLEQGLAAQARAGGAPAARTAARAGLLLALADVERAAGNFAAARVRLSEARRLDLSGALLRRAQAVEQAVAAGEVEGAAERAGAEWPEPSVPPELRARLLAAERQLETSTAGALREAEALSALHPAWRAPRWLRTRALLALGRLDDGARELSALLRLDPGHAAAWRLLGETLAEHGGQFEAERADEALRRALALEPAWSELWLVRGRLLLRRGRPAEALRALERLARELRARGASEPAELGALLAAARAQASGADPRDPRAPSEAPAEARALLREAQELAGRGDAAAAQDKVAAALAQAPSLAEAAALRWALGGPTPDEAARLLWDDAPGLVRLAEAVRAAAVQQALRAAASPPEAEAPPPEADAGAPDPADGGPSPVRALPDARAAAQLARPWIERAAALGDGDALFSRARLRADEQDRAGALEDLAAAVALGAASARLDEALALRALLLGPQAQAPDPLAARSREQLAAGHAAEALAGLGGRCEGPGAPAEPERLVALGAVHDFQGELAQALACYRAALARTPDDPVAQARLSRAAARAPVSALPALAAELDRAARAGWPAAFLAQARALEAQGRTEEALAAAERFLATTAPARRAEEAARSGVVSVSPATLPPGADEPGLAEGLALRERLLRARAAAGASQRRRLLFTGLAALLLGGAGFWLFFRGRSVAAALRADPALFPAVARAVAEVRHDALKHRASALSMLGAAPRPEVAAALLEPRPASALIADAFRALQQAAASRGIRLRPLRREPAFGPLFRDLRRAEEQLRRPEGPRDARAATASSRLRSHGERLGALLKLGPRTRLDAAAVSGWIRAVEAELRARGAPWVSPALQLEGLELDFPVAAEPLSTLLANLLRNAQAAAAAAPEPRVLVRVAEERDAAGRRVLRLDVGDSSPLALTLEQIEARESGRGLSLVRDLVREWQGHLAVRAEEAPLRKSVSACFPVQGA